MPPRNVAAERMPAVNPESLEGMATLVQQAEAAADEADATAARTADNLAAERAGLEALVQAESDAVHRAQHAGESAASQKNPAVRRRLEQIAKDHSAGAKAATKAREQGEARVAEAEAAAAEADGVATEARAMFEKRTEKYAARVAAEEAAAARAAEKAAAEREQRERESTETTEEGGYGKSGSSSENHGRSPTRPAPVVLLTPEKTVVERGRGALDSPPLVTGGVEMSSDDDGSPKEKTSGGGSSGGTTSLSAATKRGDFYTSYLSASERDSKKAPWLAQMPGGRGGAPAKPQKPWPENRAFVPPAVTAGRILAATESRKAKSSATPAAVAANPFPKQPKKAKSSKKKKRKEVRV
jgi:hypothetical protein